MNYVITKRDEENANFFIEPQASIKAVGKIDRSIHEKNSLWKPEEDIKEMIEAGHSFFTFSKKKNDYTPVYVSRGHIRTKGNKTADDNINNLPTE